MSNPYSYPPTIPTQAPEFVPVFFPHQSPTYVQAALPQMPHVEPSHGVEHHLVVQLLKSVGLRLYQGLQHIGLLHPLSPASGRCAVRDPSVSLPTHILEISGAYTGDTGLRLLLPCHGIVYAANCSNFAGILPPSSPLITADPASGEQTIDLPLVKFQVPSCRTFMLIHEFLYTKRGDRLMFQLLDLPPTPPSIRVEFTGMVERMKNATMGPGASRLESLVERTDIMREVANNGYSLGIMDLDFWRQLNFAHQVVVQAIQASQVPAPARE